MHLLQITLVRIYNNAPWPIKERIKLALSFVWLFSMDVGISTKWDVCILCGHAVSIAVSCGTGQPVLWSLNIPLSSSCSMLHWAHVVPFRQDGRLAVSPQAADSHLPEWGYLTSSVRVTRHFHKGCKDLKGWHSPIHPDIRVCPNPCVFGSYAPSVEPDAHMDHWQQGHCVSDTEMYQGWSQGSLDKGLFCRPAAEPSCLHINTFRPE